MAPKLKGFAQDEDEHQEVENNPFQRSTDGNVLSHSKNVFNKVEDQNKKSFFVRNFSQVEKGGIRSSVFTLFSSAVGAGILSLPKVLSMFGVLFGSFCILIFVLVSYRMHTIIWELTESTGRKTYANLFSLYFNKTVAKFVIQFFIFAQFCSLILYTAVSKIRMKQAGVS